MRVLLVEDDQVLCLGITRALQAEGWQVDALQDGASAQAAGLSQTYDAAVLDLGLPRRDGMDVLAHWRSHGVVWPVLILTARDGLHDRVQGLNAGADDYLTKPFDVLELVARLRALSRRAAGRIQDTLRFAELSLDVATHELFFRGERVPMSPREIALTELLMSRPGRVVAKDHIVSTMSSWESDFSENSVEVYISRLRKRFTGMGVTIKTVRGFGYLLDREGVNATGPGAPDGAGRTRP